MSNILVASPFQYLTDRAGNTLANGKIYVGQPNQDPQNFPANVYFDVAGTIPAPQPIRTNTAGFPCDSSGNPQRIYTPASYSIRISDQNDAQVVYAADAADGFYGVVAADLANQVDPILGTGMVGWIYELGASGSTLHDRLERGWVDVKDFGAIGDGLANDQAAFDAAASTGRTILIPEGVYNVPSGDFSGSRFYSFDGATTNNSTIAVVDPLANSLAVGVEATFPCAPDALPFGWVHENGDLLNRLVYPQLWAFAEASGNIVDEVDKAAHPGSFGRGNGTTTFSIPDKRGTVQGLSDNSAGIDTSLILGDRVSKESATGSGVDLEVIVSTPAIRGFATAVNQGTIDIQILQDQVNQNTTDISGLESGKADKRMGATAWAAFNGDPQNGTYSQTGLTVTVSMTAHGMLTGMIAVLSFTSGTAVSGTFEVTVTDANTYTITAAVAATTSGNVTRSVFIRDSENVASITRVSTGLYDVTWSTAMDSSSFAAPGSALLTMSGGAPRIFGAFLKTTAGCRIETQSGGGSFADCQVVDFSVFGGMN